jgi:hypothetical protein
MRAEMAGVIDRSCGGLALAALSSGGRRIVDRTMNPALGELNGRIARIRREDNGPRVASRHQLMEIVWISLLQPG